MSREASQTEPDAVLGYVGLGSNLANPVDQIRTAFSELETLPDTVCLARSSLYSNPPMGPQDQPDYVNAAVVLRTELSAHELLRALQAIEQAHGRDRSGQRWGPRSLDLDILLYGDHRIDAPDLKVPHPGVAERAFVLLPLAEIAPTLQIPTHGSVRELLGTIDHSSLVRLD